MCLLYVLLRRSGSAYLVLCLDCIVGILASFGTILISLLYLAVSLSRTKTKDGYDYGVPPGAQWAMCLLSPVALALGMDRVSC